MARTFVTMVGAAALIGVLAALSAPAMAQYPERPIKMIVPWAAGGDTDNIFRPFAAEFQKHIGQPVVVANVGGASGTTGAREAKAAAPDGYTVYAVHDYIHLTFYAGISDVKYTDFEPICLVAATPSVLTASAKTPWKNWQELADDAKKRPGQITVGATLGSTSHIFPAMIEKAAGVKFKFVSYDGLAPRMNALLGGHINLTDSNLTQKGKVEAGFLRYIAVASEKRDPEAPDVPTLKELGIGSYEADIFYGIVAPAKTPPETLGKLSGWFGTALKASDMQPKLDKQGLIPVGQCGAPFGAHLRKMSDDYRQIITAANIKAD
jgi:tripartite-type tricarboxylate transporter receptor subunit TctC